MAIVFARRLPDRGHRPPASRSSARPTNGDQDALIERSRAATAEHHRRARDRRPGAHAVARPGRRRSSRRGTRARSGGPAIAACCSATSIPAAACRPRSRPSDDEPDRRRPGEVPGRRRERRLQGGRPRRLPLVRRERARPRPIPSAPGCRTRRSATAAADRAGRRRLTVTAAVRTRAGAAAWRCPSSTSGSGPRRRGRRAAALRGFAKLELAPGDGRVVSSTLTRARSPTGTRPRALAGGPGVRRRSGRASSSRDLPLRGWSCRG